MFDGTSNENQTAVTGAPAATRSQIYAAVWRLHFYAGLFAIPFLLMLSATGAAYLFRVDIENWLYRDLLRAPARTSPKLSGDEIVAAVQGAFPGRSVASYVPSFGPEESAKVALGGPSGGEHDHGTATSRRSGRRGGSLEVFVDPYDGRVLGSQVPNQRLMKRVRDFHGKLMMGPTGQAIVELAAGWMFILLISGLYLWFPRKAGSIWGTFLPRLGKGQRILVRDLHAVPAAYFAIALCFQIVSGMPWTFVNGKLLKGLADSSPDGPSIAQPEHFHSQPPAAPAGSAQDWLGGMKAAASPNSDTAHAGRRISLAHVVSIADAEHVAHPFQVALPVGKTGVYSVRSLSTDPRNTYFLHLDQYSGQVVGRISYSQLTPLARGIAVGIAIHEGRMWGLPNRLAGLAAATGCFFIALMGGVLWWSRRPKGRLGAPRRVPNFVLPPGVVLLSLILGLVFPLVGASMILLLLFDRLVLTRIPAARPA